VTVPTLDTSQYQEVTPADEHIPAPPTIRFGCPVHPPGAYWQATAHITQESPSQLEPSSYTAAINSPHSEQWIQAMADEMQSMQDQKVWKIANLPANRKPVGSCWVYKVKLDSSGQIDRFKACLVAQGFSQQPGIDFEEVFAPVVRYGSPSLILVLVVYNYWVTEQLDIQAAFLYGFLDEEIYMQLLQGYQNEGKYCRLLKSIYRLK